MRKTVYIYIRLYKMSCILCNSSEDTITVNGMDICHPCYKQSVANEVKHDESYIPEFKSPDQITDKIYVGDLNSACDLKELNDRGITHILILGSHLKRNFESGIQYLQLMIDDSLEQSLDPYLEMGVNFINSANGKVLIHCHSGISRSGAILVGYLMKENDWSYDEALAFAKEKRKCLSPNSNFEAQLRAM